MKLTNQLRLLAGIPIDGSLERKTTITEVTNNNAPRKNLLPKSKTNLIKRIEYVSSAIEQLKSVIDTIEEIPQLDYMGNLPSKISDIQKIIGDSNSGLTELLNIYRTQYNMYEKNKEGRKMAKKDTVSESTKPLNEISNDALSRYKTAASDYISKTDKDAISAYKDHDTETGKKLTNKANKRYSNILKATNKQFANDSKKYSDENEEDYDHDSLSDDDIDYINTQGDEELEYQEKNGFNPEDVEGVEDEYDNDSLSDDIDDINTQGDEELEYQEKNGFNPEDEYDHDNENFDDKLKSKFSFSESTSSYSDTTVSHAFTTNKPMNVVSKDKTYWDDVVEPKTAKGETPTQLKKLGDASMGDFENKIKVPASIKNQLKEQIKIIERDLKTISVTNKEATQFYKDLQNAFEQLLNYLNEGTVNGIKNAQIFMSSLMGPMLHKIPDDVITFIAKGGKSKSLKDYMNKI